MKSKEVFLKEARELLRDKRVRNTVIRSPFLMIFSMMLFFGFIFEGVGKASSQKITIVKTNNKLVDALRASKVDIREVATQEEGQKQIISGKANLVLEFDPKTDQKLGALQPVTINAYFNPDEEAGGIALGTAKQIFGAVNSAVLNSVLSSHQIPVSLAEPLKVESKPITVFKGKSSSLLRSILPYFLILFLFISGVSIAADMVAGEKEKGTLETLLVAPVSREAVAIGKFYSLCAVMIASGISTVVALVVVKLLPIPMIQKVLKDGFNLSLEGIAMMLVALLPTIAFMAGLMLFISTRSRNIREAQTTLGSVSVFVTLPAAFSQVLGVTGIGNSMWINFVPILNTSSVIRNAILGKYDWTAAAIAALIGLVLAAIFIMLAINMFKQEKVLLRI